MTITPELHRGLADLRQHWVTAAAYDVYCAREADELLRRDRLFSMLVLILTTVSSLGIFTTFVTENSALWAKILVFSITGAAAVLTAIRQQARWSEVSATLRARGEQWNRFRMEIGDYVQKVLAGSGEPADDVSKKLNEEHTKLLHEHPEVDTKKFHAIRAEMKKRFTSDYES